MDRERQARRKGENITLGGTEYTIEGVVGRGGSSIVYRAVYRDRLNRESFHEVLIKELFPYSGRGEIRRGGDGSIAAGGEGRALMEKVRDSFIQGNLANLELLRRNPEQISGNLNSYEAYGTCYSVLPVHGGKSLEALLSEGKYQSLAGAADVILKLLDILECFHKEQILHLDISPDNILVLKRQVLLIDYNSVWMMGRPEGAQFYFSEKEGYSAPEVYLKNYEAISPATDLYSVCAVFFRMVTGRRMDTEECMGRGLRRSFPKTLASFRDQPETAAYKAVQILTKGLNVLPDKRYQTVDALRADMRELTARIEGRGISASALWEYSRAEYLARKRQEGQYLSRVIAAGAAADGALLSEQDCRERLSGGARILLKGTGGMGKTQYLYRLWGEGGKRYHPEAPVYIYVPLEDYQQSAASADYIRRFILKNLKFTEETGGLPEALHELNRLLAKAGREAPRVILLLDGLNEAGSQRQNLLREIEELGSYDGVGVLVTDRTDSVKQYGLSEFETALLMPLEEAAVRKELERYGLECPKEKKLRELLRNPMMLFLYRSASVMSRENGGEEGRRIPESPEEMAGFYIESLKRLHKRIDSGNEAGQLAHAYLLEQLLPAIAGKLEKKKKTLLSLEELYGLTSRDYRNMKSKLFGLAFPQYMGKSRLILNGIANDREWFDYAVSEKLIGQLNLLEQTAEGNYGLIHENFAGYFVRKWAENQKVWRRYERKYVLKRSLAGMAAAGILLAGGAAAYRHMRPFEERISEEARGELKHAAVRLNSNVGCLDGALQAQYRILEQAGREEVLDNTSGGRDDLLEVINEAERTVEAYYRGYYRTPYDDKINYLDIVTDIFPELSKETLAKVYTEAEVQRNNLTVCMEFLKQALCVENSDYFCFYREDREKLLTAYEEYLEAVTEYYYLIYNEVYIALDKDTQAELKEQMNQTASFSPGARSWSLGAKTEEELNERMGTVLEELNSEMKTAQLDMARCRFPVKEMEWAF